MACCVHQQHGGLLPMFYIEKRYIQKLVSAGLTLAVCVPLTAQDRDRDRYDHDRDRITRIEPGTTIPVRTNETIDVDRRNNQVYTSIVDRDVRGDDGRLAIPRGSTVELIVRV